MDIRDMELDETDEIGETDEIMSEDMIFEKASVNTKLINLRKNLTEFITSVILKHELEFCHFTEVNFPQLQESLLCTTNPSITEIIAATTNKYFNQIYDDIQKQNNTELTKLILEMCHDAEYGPHILLDKLIRFTFDLHVEIDRNELVLKNKNYDLYEKSVLNQISVCLLSYNLLHVFSKSVGDERPFVNIPDGKQAFQIIIDKNISI